LDAIVHFHFSVNDLNVEPEVLGTTTVVSHDGYRIHFSLPSAEGGFLPAWGVRECALSGGSQHRESHAWLCRMVNMVRLSVELELPDAASAQHPDISAVDEVDRLVRRAADAARSCLYSYLAVIRAGHGQYWLAHSAERPEVTSLTTIVDSSSGSRISIGYGDPLRMGVWPCSKDAISMDVHESAVRSTEVEATLGVPEVLLADAMYLVWTAAVPQYREALLLAAMAAEVKIKQSLELACPESARPLLEFALHNPRDVSMQAAGLFDKAAKATVGRSLREENQRLYKDVVRLFENRNAVAHRAHKVEPESVKADIRASQEAIMWADALQSEP